MHVTPLAWAITMVILIGFLAFDIIHMMRNPHEPTLKECGKFLTFYISLALLFGVGIGLFAHPVVDKTSWDYSIEFITGFLTEYSLSIDNLFIFIILLSSMQVPRVYQQYALMCGIVLALVFRGIFIALGAAIINNFAAAFFVFGAFLLYTGVKLFLDWRKENAAEESGEDEPVEGDNVFMRWVKRVVPSTEEYHETHMSVKIAGKRVVTPMFFVVVALGSIDLMFALDSIPAIFGLTQEPYLVFTANFFALMGLRQLYFLLGGLLEKLVYLSVGLSFILCFIAFKLVLHALHHYDIVHWEMPNLLSLAVIIVTLTITAVASLSKSRRDEQAQA